MDDNNDDEESLHRGEEVGVVPGQNRPQHLSLNNTQAQDYYVEDWHRTYSPYMNRLSPTDDVDDVDVDDITPSLDAQKTSTISNPSAATVGTNLNSTFEDTRMQFDNIFDQISTQENVNVDNNSNVLAEERGETELSGYGGETHQNLSEISNFSPMASFIPVSSDSVENMDDESDTEDSSSGSDSTDDSSSSDEEMETECDTGGRDSPHLEESVTTISNIKEDVVGDEYDLPADTAIPSVSSNQENLSSQNQGAQQEHLPVSEEFVTIDLGEFNFGGTTTPSNNNESQQIVLFAAEGEGEIPALSHEPDSNVRVLGDAPGISQEVMYIVPLDPVGVSLNREQLHIMLGEILRNPTNFKLKIIDGYLISDDEWEKACQACDRPNGHIDAAKILFHTFFSNCEIVNCSKSARKRVSEEGIKSAALDPVRLLAIFHAIHWIRLCKRNNVSPSELGYNFANQVDATSWCLLENEVQDIDMKIFTYHRNNFARNCLKCPTTGRILAEQRLQLQRSESVLNEMLMEYSSTENPTILCGENDVNIPRGVLADAFLKTLVKPENDARAAARILFDALFSLAEFKRCTIKGPHKFDAERRRLFTLLRKRLFHIQHTGQYFYTAITAVKDDINILENMTPAEKTQERYMFVDRRSQNKRKSENDTPCVAKVLITDWQQRRKAVTDVFCRAQDPDPSQ